MRYWLVLLLSTAVWAQPHLTAPAQPCWCLPGERVTLEVEADPGQTLSVQAPDGPNVPLAEGPSGHYLASLVADKTRSLMLVSQGQVLAALGTLECLESVRPTVQVSKPDAVFRSGPGDDDDRYDPLPQGVRLEVSGRRGDWLRAGTGWVRAADCQVLPPGTPASQAILSLVTSSETPDRGAQVRLRLGEPCAWQTREDLGRLFIRLPGARMQMLETAYPSHPQRIQLIQLHPGPEGTEVELGVGRLWGYQLRWEAPDLVVSLGPPPARPSLEGVRVTLDPGHGGTDNGAIGVHGTREKDLNLAVAQALRQELEKAGAVVTMTRDGDREVSPDGSSAEVELNSRVDLSARSGAQLFVSIHHNAAPDVAVARRAHGTHVYFYRPQSRELAEAIAGPTAAAIGETSCKHLWRSFNVTRQTAAPAVLVEVNFVSNPSLEQDMLTQPGYPQRAAAGIRKGLEDFVLKAVGQQ